MHRSALITGASSGIGAAFAKVLPQETSLLLTGRNAAQLGLTADRSRADRARVDTITADLATTEGRTAVIERAEQAEIDLLICNAGAGWHGPFLGTPYEVSRETIEINILGTLELLHALLPEMCARAQRNGSRCGAIVVSSCAAFGSSNENMASYAATKAFAVKFVQSLVAELKHEPVDVLAICPTYTATDFFARAGHPEPDQAMTPEQVAQEAMEALGRRTVHICGLNHAINRLPVQIGQFLMLLLARNPDLAVWRRLHRNTSPQSGAKPTSDVQNI